MTAKVLFSLFVIFLGVFLVCGQSGRGKGIYPPTKTPAIQKIQPAVVKNATAPLVKKITDTSIKTRVNITTTPVKTNGSKPLGPAPKPNSPQPSLLAKPIGQTLQSVEDTKDMVQFLKDAVTDLNEQMGGSKDFIKNLTAQVVALKNEVAILKEALNKPPPCCQQPCPCQTDCAACANQPMQPVQPALPVPPANPTPPTGQGYCCNQCCQNNLK